MSDDEVTRIRIEATVLVDERADADIGSSSEAKRTDKDRDEERDVYREDAGGPPALPGVEMMPARRLRSQ